MTQHNHLSALRLAASAETEKDVVEPVDIVEKSADAEKSAATQQLGKRKRKIPLYHKEYTTSSSGNAMAVERSEDELDLDEEHIFKSAKIEYTNADGSKSLDDFACPKCPAQFESRVGLTNHMVSRVVIC